MHTNGNILLLLLFFSISQKIFAKAFCFIYNLDSRTFFSAMALSHLFLLSGLFAQSCIFGLERKKGQKINSFFAIAAPIQTSVMYFLLLQTAEWFCRIKQHKQYKKRHYHKV